MSQPRGRTDLVAAVIGGLIVAGITFAIAPPERVSPFGYAIIGAALASLVFGAAWLLQK